MAGRPTGSAPVMPFMESPKISSLSPTPSASNPSLTGQGRRSKSNRSIVPLVNSSTTKVDSPGSERKPSPTSSVDNNYLPTVDVTTTTTSEGESNPNKIPFRTSDPPLTTSGSMSVDNELVHLNIGGSHITTTRTTLLSKGQNFFVPLLSGKIPTVKDETGAFFIDRSGEYFTPILNFLRYGQLIIPPHVNLLSVLHEAVCKP